jgi:DNA-binding SARP family transcriptional activator
MGEELRLRLLGGVTITRGDTPVEGFVSAKAQALLCYLAVTGCPHSRQALAGLLWGEMPEAAARTNLRQALSNLRRLVGSHLRITRHTVAFDREALYWLDVEAFQSAIEKGLPVEGADLQPASLRAAVDLFTNLLQDQANRIGDEKLRRSFLENVAAHREILSEWAQVK